MTLGELDSVQASGTILSAGDGPVINNISKRRDDEGGPNLEVYASEKKHRDTEATICGHYLDVIHI